MFGPARAPSAAGRYAIVPLGDCIPNMASYGVQFTGKFGAHVLFSVLRKVDIEATIGEIVQDLAADNFVVKNIKASKENCGPFSDLLLSETVSLLQDFGYRYVVATLTPVSVTDTEEDRTKPNAFEVLMSSSKRRDKVDLQVMKKTTSSGKVDQDGMR